MCTVRMACSSLEGVGDAEGSEIGSDLPPAVIGSVIGSHQVL